MNPTEMIEPSVGRRTRFWREWWPAIFLFIATVLVVIWQNSRLAVLWDLSYVLEHSYRISLGDIPYRDFPFAHAPLTFLIQAAIIKVTGRVYWHTIVYCAVVGGLATVMSWRVMLNVLRDSVPRPRLVAFLLSLPLVVLGVYCVFPHPFYDPDCIFVVLAGVLFLQGLERKKFAMPHALLAGAALVVPIFVKQNIGLAFIASGVLALMVLLTIELVRRRSIRTHVLTLASAAVTFAMALWLIHVTAGLKNYWHWTIQFAAERRTPARAEMLGIYRDKILVLWLAIFAAGVLLFWLSRHGRRVLAIVSSLLMAAPFIWPVIYLLRDWDPSERADRLLMIWPVFLIVSLVVAVMTIKRRRGIALVLPFTLIATIHGTFMSQQLWGSTYAIWPLFMILIAATIAGLNSFSNSSSAWMTMPLVAIVVASLLVSGGFYVWSHERLNYSNLTDGELVRSILPPLKGLATRGDWIPDFEDLVRYSEANILRDDGVLLIPGEDPFYYTTGRRPTSPIIFFDHTTNPYSPEETVQLCREKNIRWVIVKQELQLEEDPVGNLDRLIELLEQDYEQVESLGNYDIYRRNDSDSDDGTDAADSHQNTR